MSFLTDLFGVNGHKADRVVASHVAAAPVMTPDEIAEKIGITPMSEEEKAADRQELVAGIDKGTARELVLGVAEGGLPIGPLAYTAPFFSFIARDEEARQALARLTDTYRNAIAEKMGVEPETVTDRMTLLYAAQNPNLRGAIEYIAHKRDAHVWSNGVGVGTMMGGAALGTALLGPLGAIAGMIGGMGAGMLGYELGKDVSDTVLGVSDGRNPQAIMEALEEKRANGLMITAGDVFALRVAQNVALGERIEFQYGAPFHELAEGERTRVMQDMAPMTRQAVMDAFCCNDPNAKLQHLMLGRMPVPMQTITANSEPAPESWAGRVAATRHVAPQHYGYAAQVMQERQAAALAAQQPDL